MANLSDIKLEGLAKHLVDSKLFSKDEAIVIQEEARNKQISFVAACKLVSNKAITDTTIAHIHAQQFGMPLVDMDAIDTAIIDMRYVNESLIRKHNVLPLSCRGNRLYIAVSEPTNMEVLSEFQFSTGLHIRPIIVEEKKLSLTIEQFLDDLHLGGLDADLNEDLINQGQNQTDSDSDSDSEDGIEDAPIVRFVSSVLATAIKLNASDIHFEPYENLYRVRIRVDGILKESRTAPITLGARIAARLKVLANLNIANRRSPQDGRMRAKLSATRKVDFRVSTCPTLFGEKVVLRILDPASAQLGIDALGYEQEQKEIFLKAIHQPRGLVLVVGPTGSGKTVSLYTALNILNNPDRNISTAEDPIEISLTGINQVQINPTAGLEFPDILRSFLRQDPDIIMVGEIRDLETADIAIKASHTGHMVLSTLHTNDAPQTLTRLVNMGISPFNIASAVTLIIAQRLARRLCGDCKKNEHVPTEALQKEGFTEAQIKQGITVYEPVGCEECSDGYRGRVGIYQVMPVSALMGNIIMEGGNANQITEQAKKEGIADLRASGLKKVIDGLTSIEEVNRIVTGE